MYIYKHIYTYTVHIYVHKNYTCFMVTKKSSDYRTFGLSNLRIIEPSDYRTFGLSIRNPKPPLPCRYNALFNPTHYYKWSPKPRSEEHTSELQSQSNLVCRLLLEKKKK